MSFAALTAFWAVSFLLVLTPGADWAYVISAGLRGRRLVLPATVGLACGALLATLAVAAGVGALVARNPALLTALTATGALYLAWMGIGLWRSPAAIQGGDDAEAGTRWHWTLKGASVSGLNPKQLLLLLALLPQFVRPADHWPVFAQIMALGAVHAASCAVVYFGVGWGSQSVLRSRPAAAQLVSRISGTLMLGIALLLLVEMAWH
ncbi:LysE family translocator [Comamonas guangdongensis]|uniref:LysE family translocator n=1 Tax=Comamonas guangdongensis TaxID=510515 RepID=A0ABV3ZT72_9BURK